MKKILAITPFFGKSGSEIALFNLMDSVKEIFHITIYTRNNNPELKRVLHDDINLIFQDSKKTFLIFRKIIKKIKSFLRNESKLEKLINKNNYDFILLNTILSLRYMQVIRNKNLFVIVYVHENEDMLIGMNKDRLYYLLNEVDLVLCSSNYVKKYLVSLGRKNKIEVLYPSLDFSKFILPIKKKNIRDELGINKNDFLWVMSGGLTINKNPKMFIDIASQIIKKNREVYFLWIGFPGKSAYEVFLEQKVKDLGIGDKVKFIENKQDDYFNYVNEIDGLLLTSFSESYSLVSKEAACFNKPVVSFDCGGINEAVPKESLFVSKEYSVEEITNQMYLIMDSKKRYIKKDDLDFLFSNEKEIVSKRFLELLNKRSDA